MSTNFKVPVREDKSKFGLPIYKRSWTQSELISTFPDDGIKILDIGAGRYPFAPRAIDELVTLDFDNSTEPTIATDFTREWPFGPNGFDLVYASHVIEHLYPRDRDTLIMRIFVTLRPGGILFIRVPHRSSFQATGWEHYTFYGTNGATSLTHGRNPYLPQFDLVSAGVALGDLDRFRRDHKLIESVVEGVLNKSFRLTDRFLCVLLGGVPEVQFMLRKPLSKTAA
jgi:SAM-dependent methyltransferase